MTLGPLGAPSHFSFSTVYGSRHGRQKRTPNPSLSILSTPKSDKKPPVPLNKRLFWYARCDSNARPLESERFVAIVSPLITALKVQFMTVFPRYITCFSGATSRQKQAADAKNGRQTSTSRRGFSCPITPECAAEPEAAAPWSERYETRQGNPHRCWSQSNC